MANILDLEFEDEELQECVLVYNEIAETLYPDILQLNHVELYLQSAKRISPTTWKKFLLNEKVQDWYAQERKIIMGNKVDKMINEIGKNHSTAQMQGLSTLLGQINRDEGNRESNEIIIYNFVPLNAEEEKNPNVKVLQNVPNQIRNAIQTINKSIKK